MAEGPSSFSPDTLWEYLNGGAPRYEAYGFERLVHSRYQLGEDPLASVIADVYDMGSALGAFGIYRSIRPSDAVVRTWGAEGYRSGTVAAAWKGAVFVHAAADDERPELIEAMEMIVSRVCDRADGGLMPPPILDSLPPKGLVPYSERLRGIQSSRPRSFRRGGCGDLRDRRSSRRALLLGARERGRSVAGGGVIPPRKRALGGGRGRACRLSIPGSGIGVAEPYSRPVASWPVSTVICRSRLRTISSSG